MEPIRIGLLGLGTVGAGVVEVLTRNQEEIARRAGRAMVVTQAAVRRLDQPRGCDCTQLTLTTDPQAVVESPDVDIVVELMGGEEPANSLILKAIANGKPVVTANKALIATCGNSIFSAAQSQGVMVAFEAAVAGGIPIVKALREGLSANRITKVVGIINGTCNYILSAMQQEGVEFQQALSQAQAAGYAEADPTFDIEGVDAAHKLTILGALAFGIPLQYDAVSQEGVTAVTQQDVAFAQQLGYHIKHLGIAERTPQGVNLRVHPTLVSQQQLLAHVNGAMNAILVDGDAVGTTVHYGQGAGAEPTASSVVADLVDVVRTLTADPHNRVPHLAFQPDEVVDLPLLPLSEVCVSHYLRLQAHDEPGVLAQVTQILGDEHISIEAILQKEPLPGQTTVPIVILTQPVKERAMVKAMNAMAALEHIPEKPVGLRVEETEVSLQS